MLNLILTVYLPKQRETGGQKYKIAVSDQKSLTDFDLKFIVKYIRKTNYTEKMDHKHIQIYKNWQIKNEKWEESYQKFILFFQLVALNLCVNLLLKCKSKPQKNQSKWSERK